MTWSFLKGRGRPPRKVSRQRHRFRTARKGAGIQGACRRVRDIHRRVRQIQRRKADVSHRQMRARARKRAILRRRAYNLRKLNIPEYRRSGRKAYARFQPQERRRSALPGHRRQDTVLQRTRMRRKEYVTGQWKNLFAASGKIKLSMSQRQRFQKANFHLKKSYSELPLEEVKSLANNQPA